MYVKTLFYYLVLGCTLLGFAAAPEQPLVDTLATRVDSLFANWNKTDSPGCVCAVMQDGKIAYAKAFGMEDLEHEVPLSLESVFHVASISKQFTAAAIALLVMSKTVSLDDAIHKYLPEFPEFDKPILIRHLLYHTSGLRDYHDLLGMTGWYDTDYLNNEIVLELLMRQRELNFQPGCEFLYSNSGYLLLAEIVKRATGEKLPQFTEEHIFRPLGMNSTHFEDDHRQVVRHRVISYEPREGGGYNQLLKNSDAYGDVNLLTTILDLAQWIQNFSTAEVGGAPFLNLMLRRGVLTNGDTLDYAFGLEFGKYRGLLTVGNSALQQGFRAEMVYFIQQRFAVIVLCNLKSINSADLAYRIADLYLAPHFPEAETQAAPQVTVDREAVIIDTLLLNTYAGVYEYEANRDQILSFTREGNRFFGWPSREKQIEIFASSDSTFFSPGIDAQVTFHRNPDGSVSYLTLRNQQGDQVAKRLNLYIPTSAELAEYEGIYYCTEVDTKYNIEVVDNSLVITQKGQRRQVLAPREHDMFNCESGRIVFIRNDHNQIIGLHYTGGRIRNLLIERQK